MTKEGDRCYEGLLVGKKLNQKYLIERAIGSGSQAVVFVASYKKQKYAVKCYKDKDGYRRKQAENEISILGGLKHKNIIQKIDSFEEQDHLFLVTEYCETDLAKIIFNVSSINNFNPNECFLNILDAVDYLHKQGLSHRDLKPANILIQGNSKPIAKIADFGMYTDQPQMRGKFTGTRRYASPELLSDKSGYPWAKNDVFSLGVILFNLRTGQQPWGTLGINLTLAENIELLLKEFEDKYQFSDSLLKIFRFVFGKSESRPNASSLRDLFVKNVLYGG